jgi:phosphopantothenoylcysteine synthetase/decarboxylase
MCWDDYVTDGTSFYRPLMNKAIQQAFTAEIRHIGLEGDNNKTKLKRISASKASTIKKVWTCVEDNQLKGTVFEWEAPSDTHTLWTSPNKVTRVTCVQTPPNTNLGAILGQTGTLVSGENENTIQIKFITEKIMWQREHAPYITVAEPNCLCRITDLRPDANNHIMAKVTKLNETTQKRTTG